MVEPVASDKPSNKPKGTTERSPRYPFIPLRDALDRARAIYKAEGRNAASAEVIAGHWKYGPKSSGGRQIIAALRSFGLIENGAGGRLKLANAAIKILLDEREPSPERDELLKKAALAPAIHQKLWDLYKTELPSDAQLRYTLRAEHGFSSGSVDDFIKNYKDNLAFAKLTATATMASPAETDPKVKAPFAVGDLVDWESQGVLQNAEPLRLVGFSDDRSHAFVEGHRTGLPVSQLTRAQAVERPTMEATNLTGAPRIVPAAASSQALIPVAPLAPAGVGQGIRQDIFSLAEGQAVLRWPENLSPESFEDFRGWLELVLRKVARSAGVKTK